jgi:thiamine-monophosphate kinase
MKLSNLGEFGLINRIQKLSSRNTASVLTGIGDDAAVLKLSASQVMVVTTDLLIEDVHFDLAYTDFYGLGWKSAAVNLSDIAAMGGVSRFCLTALGIPPRITVDQISAFYRGFNALLRKCRTALVGGDTCSSPDKFFVSVTAIGEAKPARILTRSGARPGDRVFVTGALGDSAAGLEMLQNKNERAGSRGREAKKIMEKHLRPVPRLDEGRKIALTGCAHAMIDISDGLSSDLSHICKQSGVGAEIMADHIPISSSLHSLSKELSKEDLQYALHGGEDYELLFAVPRNRMKKVLALNLPLREIGCITAGRKISLVHSNGKKTALKPEGFDHFSSAKFKSQTTGLKRNHHKVSL